MFIQALRIHHDFRSVVHSCYSIFGVPSYIILRMTFRPVAFCAGRDMIWVWRTTRIFNPTVTITYASRCLVALLFLNTTFLALCCNAVSWNDLRWIRTQPENHLPAVSNVDLISKRRMHRISIDIAGFEAAVIVHKMRRRNSVHPSFSPFSSSLFSHHSSVSSPFPLPSLFFSISSMSHFR